MSSEALADPATQVPNMLVSADETDHLQPPAGFVDTPANRSSYGTPSNQSMSSTQPLNTLANQNPFSTPRESTALVDKEGQPAIDESPEEPPVDLQAGRAKKRPWPLIAGAVALLLVIVIAVVVPVIVTRKHNGTAASSSGNGRPASPGSTGGAKPPTASTGAISGGYGSVITTETGSTFTYQNTFGGIWVSDPNDPFNDGAQAQSWSKPLNQTWVWGVDHVRGVNLGGWLVPEPFIVPALFEPYLNASPPAKDEWTLSENMAADTANGGLAQLETHYATFITEEDFAQIASAGLNWIRLPIPFWAISTFPGEPFLEGVSWKYVLKAFAWARKYGLRINLDLHTMPGSQNGYNHSGKQGEIDWLYGVMGLANSERGLDYMRIIVEFITQKEFANLIPLFGVVNEPVVSTIGMDVMGSFYLHMHQILRNITGIGEGNGPYLSIHDGFHLLSSWAAFLPGRDRVALDSHPYMCFSDPDYSPLAQQVTRPCDEWAESFNASRSIFGVTTAGEWSLAWNDCGYWVNGINAGTRWEQTLGGGVGGGSYSCAQWDDWESWDQTTKNDLQQLALASMDALDDWFFWTWKIGNSSITGKIGSPFWSYSLGLANGWIPTDPRTAVGTCGGGSPATPFQPSMTGGPGSGDFSEQVIAANPWPPTTLGPGGYPGASLPTYTQTGMPIPTLAMPAVTGAGAASEGNGWFDAQDTVPIFTPIAGCSYPNAWDANDIPVPPPCGGGRRRSVRDTAPLPKRTPVPS